MQKLFLFVLVISLFAGKTAAQFDFDKFVTEKVSKPDKNVEINMEEMMKKAIDGKLNNFAVKVVNARTKSGNIIFKSVANANLVVAEAKKINDLMLQKLTKILGKPAKQNEVNGVKNNAWGLADGTTYMLTYSGNLCMLVIMNR
jgi:hypothetical protein